jgi:hypothetical protein
MSTIKSSAENLTLNADGANNDIKFQSNGSEVASIDQAGVIVSAGGSTHADNVKAKFGTGNDLEIFHDGTNSKVYSPGDLLLESNSNILLKRNESGGATMLKAVIDGAVELYHDNTKKFETIAGGARIPSGGLLFGSDTAAANALDDYEEGSFTPALTFGGNAGGDFATGTNVGFYTKIGNFVHFCLRTTLTNKGSSTGNTTMGGLPFAVGGTTGQFGGANINFSQNWTNDNPTPLSGEYSMLVMDSGSILIQFRRIATNGGFNSSTNGDWADNTDIIITGQYRV